MKPKNVMILILGSLFLIVLLQNTQVVTLRLLFWKVEMSRIIFIPGVMLIGFGLGYFAGRSGKKKRYKE